MKDFVKSHKGLATFLLSGMLLMLVGCYQEVDVTTLSVKEEVDASYTTASISVRSNIASKNLLFRVYIATDSSMNSIINKVELGDAREGTIKASVTNLEDGKQYYYQVECYSTASKKKFDVSTFSTMAAPSFQDFTINGVAFRMIKVEGGTFSMGAQSTNSNVNNYDPVANSDEDPVHSVALRSYYIGQTEVSQGLWDAVMGEGGSSHGAWGSYGKGSEYPAYNISYVDVQSFLVQLNAITGMNFRMPTEAEWEFAARGGNLSLGYQYSGSNTLDDVAWYGDNSGNQAHVVASKQPNELGLYDMSGNVWEWCQDWYGVYSSESQSNPFGPNDGSDRVHRGGFWNNSANMCRSTRRRCCAPDVRHNYLGVRLVLVF